MFLYYNSYHKNIEMADYVVYNVYKENNTISVLKEGIIMIRWLIHGFFWLLGNHPIELWLYGGFIFGLIKAFWWDERLGR